MIISARTSKSSLRPRGTRHGHEKTLRELKQHLAFDTGPSQDGDTNTAWLLISTLAYSVVRRFQLSHWRVRAPQRPWVLGRCATLWYESIKIPAKIATPNGCSQLRLAAAHRT